MVVDYLLEARTAGPSLESGGNTMFAAMLSLAWLLSPSTGAQGSEPRITNRRLSGSMPSDVVSDAWSPLISPDGSRVLYTVLFGPEVQVPSNSPARLYVAPMDGSAPAIPLTPLVSGLPFESLHWTPDGTRAVFGVSSGGSSVVEELYSVETDGSSAPVLLNPQGGLIRAFPSFKRTIQLTADGSRVIYELSLSNGQYALESVPVDGSAAPVRLVTSQTSDLDFLTCPQGSIVVYRADRQIVGRFELYATPADGSTPAIKVSSSATPHDVADFQIDATGTRVVYRPVLSPQNLFSALLDASAPVVQLSPTVAGRTLDTHLISPDGTNVVYRANHSPGGQYELFLVPIDGSAPAQLLAPVSPGGAVQNGYRFSPDGGYVVFQANTGGATPQSLLFSARTSDGVLASLHALTNSNFQISPDSTRVVFNQDSLGLDSVPIDGGSPAVRITPAFVPNGRVFSYEVTSDSLQVVYSANAEISQTFELYRVALVPSGTPVATRLSPTLVAGGSIIAPFDLAPDSSRVALGGDASRLDVNELFASSLAAQDVRVLSAPLPVGAVGHVQRFVVQKGHVAYAADQDTDETVELYGVPYDGSAAPQKLSGTLASGGDVMVIGPSIRLSPDGETVLYLADAEVDERYELYSVPWDASAAPVRLNGTIATGGVLSFQISADGTRVVYLANQVDSPGAKLRSVPIHGGPATILGPSSGFYEITSDSAHVVFLNGRLYSVPIDGSAAPVDLSEAFSSSSFKVSPDGSRVVFMLTLNGTQRLFGNSISGGARVDLSGTLVSGGNVQSFDITPGGEFVLYRADAQTDERFLLLGIPIDGSAPRRTLNGPMVGGGDVLSFEISPDDAHAVYLADADQNELQNLYSVPVDGSAPSTRLTTSAVLDFDITAAGSHVLASVGGDILSFSLSGGSTLLVPSVALVYTKTRGATVIYEKSDALYSVPVTGGPALRLTPDELLVADLSFALDGARTLYLADEGVTNGLYVSLREKVAPRTH